MGEFIQGAVQHGCVHACASTSFIQLATDLLPVADSRGPFRRICELMRKADAQSVLVHRHVQEESYFSKKYPAVAEEISALGPATTVTQVTFFSSSLGDPPSLPKATKEDPSGGILGTCVIVTPNQGAAYVFEAVVAYPTINSSNGRVPLQNAYYHIGTETTIKVGGEPYELEASYFCQQNGTTSVCFHSCLKMTLWYMNEFTYQPSTKKINDILKKIRPHYEPKNGFHLQDFQHVCKTFKTDVLTVDVFNNANLAPYAYEIAYLLVESGIPTIVVFAPRSDDDSFHMFPLVGHTLDSDEWFPIALDQYPDLPRMGLRCGSKPYLPSAEFVPRLIAHDDLLGPYFHLAHDSLVRATVPASDPMGRIRWVLGLVPSGSLERSPHLAQEIGGRYVTAIWETEAQKISDPWKTLLLKEQRLVHPNLLVRTIHMYRDDYLNNLRTITDHDGNRIDDGSVAYLEGNLPDRFWLTEFSTPRLFTTNMSKLGDVILPIDCGIKTIGNEQDVPYVKTNSGPPPIAFRLIDRMTFYNKGILTLPFKTHIPLYRGPIGIRRDEK